jgi:O-antigen/teichoic acid export membrane protein
MANLSSPGEGRAINALNVVLGLCLFLSPLLFGFTDQLAAATNAWLSGGLVAFTAFIALTDFEEWEEWINLVVGLWVTVSPWLFGFAGATYAMWSHASIGLAVTILAGIEIWKLHRNPPHGTV